MIHLCGACCTRPGVNRIGRMRTEERALPRLQAANAGDQGISVKDMERQVRQQRLPEMILDVGCPDRRQLDTTVGVLACMRRGQQGARARCFTTSRTDSRICQCMSSSDNLPTFKSDRCAVTFLRFTNCLDSLGQRLGQRRNSACCLQSLMLCRSTSRTRHPTPSMRGHERHIPSGT